MTRLLFTALFVLYLVPFAEAQAVREVPKTQRNVGAGYDYAAGPLGFIAKAQISDDDVFYNPTTGQLVVGITNHPQRSGWEGALFTPGDCYYVFNTHISGAKLTLVDKWGTGFKTIRLYRAHDGLVADILVTILDMPNCDTTDAF